MHKAKYRASILYSMIVLLIVAVVGGAMPSPRAAETNVPLSATNAFKQNERLGRGVNIIGYDPIWRDRSRGRFQAEHFRLIREAGFSHVRINLHPFRNARAGGTHRISDAWLKTLDWAIEQALANKLLVVLDFHEFNVMGRDPLGNKERFLSMWRQIAERYKNRPKDVLFEILNEPHGKLTAELWNEFLREALEIIRRTNPDRTIVIGASHYNTISHLEQLELPKDDRNIIVAIHYYSPMEFTHQGAPWTGQRDKVGVAWNGTPPEREAIARAFDKAQGWSQKKNRPLYLGEFGAYDKAEMSSRVRYLNFVTREAEKRGWSWAYWQFDSDFIVYDIPQKRWIEPILNALIPPRNQ